jgi:hypothetical protein
MVGRMCAEVKRKLFELQSNESNAYGPAEHVVEQASEALIFADMTRARRSVKASLAKNQVPG